MSRAPRTVRKHLVDEHRKGTGYLLALLGADAAARLRDAFARHGLSPRQFHVLALLSDEGELDQTRLGRLMGLPASAVVALLNPLESAGLVARQRLLADRRRHVVVPTEAGRTSVRAASQAHRAAEEHLLRRLTQAQREQLHALIVEAARDLTDAQQATCESD